MRNELTLFHKILFQELRPWVKSTEQEIVFRESLKDISSESYQFQPIYEVGFIKPLLPFRKYYHRLIESESIRYLNFVVKSVNEADTKNEKKYWVNTTLYKKIKDKLNATAQIIIQRDYDIDLLKLSKDRKITSSINEDETYVIHFLKTNLIWLYLEIQEHFKDYLKEDYISEEELYEIYFREPAPSPSFIFPSTVQSISQTKQIILPEKPKIVPKVVIGDLTPAPKGVLSYEDIIKNSTRFAEFEEKLRDKDLITVDYKFKNKYGQKQLLAAIYHQLIRKSYFYERQFLPKRKITNSDVRKFLDNRYDCNLDKQFRIWANSEPELVKTIESHYWIDNLTPC